MANPTGSVYLTAAPGYVWTDGDVYEIAQTDEVEGAATGASFGGLGVDNEPHQMLLNKIQHTHLQQLTNVANIATLLNIWNNFIGSLQLNGYVRIPINDVSRGFISLFVQWGQVYLNGVTINTPTTYTVSWPVRFPNGILLQPFCSLAVAAGTSGDPDPGVVTAQSWNAANGTFAVTPAITDVDPISFNFLAIGF